MNVRDKCRRNPEIEVTLACAHKSLQMLLRSSDFGENRSINFENENVLTSLLPGSGLFISCWFICSLEGG